MSGTPEGPGTSNIPESKESRSLAQLSALSWKLLFFALVTGFVVWDFSEIIFANQHRQAALEIIRPGMRLTTAERKLNQQHYTTLYKSSLGSRPATLDVGTCRRLPWTLQVARKTLPRWLALERMTDSLLAATHFEIVADKNGIITANSSGQPLVMK